MVSTRRQAAAAEEIQSDVGNTIVVQTPASTSRKRSRKSTQDDMMTPTKRSSPAKKRKLPVPAGNEGEQMETHTHTHIAVEIPVSSVAPNSAKGSSRETSSSSPERKGENNVAPQDGLEIQDSDHDNEDDLVGNMEEKAPRASRKSQSLSAKRSSGKASEEAAAKDFAARPKHRKFGSDEPEIELPETELQIHTAESLESENESSDDEAPEEVVTQNAGQEARRDLKAAAKALEEQESKNRKKRRERDAFLKQQAEKATKKRKQQEDAAGRSMESDASDSEGDNSAAFNVDVANVEASVESPEESSADVLVGVLNKKSAINKRASLPDLLPSEFLDDGESEESDNEVVVEESQRKSKKIKFSDLVEKKPKDLRKGSTTFRVAESRSKLLAPKASIQARKTKEEWIQGRPGKNGAKNRKPFSSGFFVSRK
ncbi:hypothetical protein BP5796_10056 [Coleophoma crateriformis]|uniref:Uncharacterized protein n=1 Tax=Coleophoma crateriformis TaxID=565419 RepID=A0A3D8QV38_9HELO|nr:hypothetical protein BP5796_10056 [Coleophoma crateriformis]